jgi:GNAT superfamily N-acetyltransferase
LPFSVNIIGCLNDFDKRSIVYFITDKNDIKACLLIFKSSYNDHIWHDPTIWIIGNNVYSEILMDKISNKKFVMMSLFNINEVVKIKFPEVKVFNENIMARKNDNIDNGCRGDVRILSESDAMQSLKLNGNIEQNKDLRQLIEDEKRFINERICFGKFIDNKLVARGAIMSITGGYSSIGGFYTLETERRKGYMSGVINCVLNEAGKYSSNSCLFVRDNNDGAISLYKKSGFKPVNRIWFYDVNTGLSP